MRSTNKLCSPLCCISFKFLGGRTIPNEFEAAFSAGVDIAVTVPQHPSTSTHVTTGIGGTLSAILSFLSH